MEKIICLNLSEMMNGIYEKDGTYVTVLKQILKESGYQRVSRIYIGSSFCASYYLRMTKEMMRACTLACEALRCKVTLVVPMFAQRYLEQGKKKTEELLQTAQGYADEVTVNDFGMLAYMNKTQSVKLNLGRLFMKDYRDKRYMEYFSSCLHPKIWNPEMEPIIKEYQIHGMELDLTHKVIDLGEIPETFTIAIHYPYCYQTVGNICEIGSIGHKVSEKYRANAPCDCECDHTILKYQTKEGGEYIKHGRAVFFENPDCEIKNRKEIRLIYTSTRLGGRA